MVAKCRLRGLGRTAKARREASPAHYPSARPQISGQGHDTSRRALAVRLGSAYLRVTRTRKAKRAALLLQHLFLEESIKRSGHGGSPIFVESESYGDLRRSQPLAGAPFHKGHYAR